MGALVLDWSASIEPRQRGLSVMIMAAAHGELLAKKNELGKRVPLKEGLSGGS
jgi:hypothetical protein